MVRSQRNSSMGIWRSSWSGKQNDRSKLCGRVDFWLHRSIFSPTQNDATPELRFSLILLALLRLYSLGCTSVRDIFAEKPSDCFPWILLLDEGFPDENLQQTQRRSQISTKSKECQVASWAWCQFTGISVSWLTALTPAFWTNEMSSGVNSPDSPTTWYIEKNVNARCKYFLFRWH